MNTSRNSIRTLLVGSGRELSDLLASLSTRSRFLELDLIGVVDLTTENEAEVRELAREMGILLVVSDLSDLPEDIHPQLAILTSAEASEYENLVRILPEGVPVLGPDTAGILKGMIRLVEENRALRSDSRRLKETRLRLNVFVETAPLAIYVKDTNLRYKKMNRHSLRLMGLNEESVLGKTDHALFPAGRVRWLQKVEQETLLTGKTLHATGILPVRGLEMHVQVTLFPIIENKKTEGLYGLVEDTTELFVSEQKLHEVDEQLNETQKYLREVLENSRDMIFLTDPEGNILSFNSGAEKVLGYKREDVVGLPAHSLCALPSSFAKLFEKSLLDGHATRYEAEFMNKSGQPVICNISLTKIDGPDGLPLEVVCLCRDITTRLRLKNNLIRSERLAAVGQMASGVAHEINNPLAVIDTIAGLVEETIADEGASLEPATRDILTKAMGRLHYQVKRCTSITHSLLGFVRNTSTGLVKIDLEALLDECLNVLGIEIRRSQTEIIRMFSTNLPEFTSDPMLLQQVFVNLIKNALDAIEEVPDRSGVVEITTNTDRNRISVTIQDNGVGIPKNDQEKIFDLFHTTKPAGKGTGLGLSIVHDILYRLGGNIRLISEPGLWSRFIVELPLEPPETPLPDPTSMNL
ncbi:MAG: PAS domain S-box protein [Gemmatimonadales bacterium]|nr:PAS domain S-box protein [Gemmatimonadales bacterium]